MLVQVLSQMLTRASLAWIIGPLFLLLGHAAAAPYPGVPVSNGLTVSRFEQGTEGWTLWNSSQAIEHDSRGFITAPDAGVPWCWNAPEAFLGDQSAALGGSLSLLVRDDLQHGDEPDGPGLVLRGGGLELGHRGKPRQTEAGGWLTVTASLEEGRGWRNLHADRPATRGELSQALSRLNRLLVRGTWHRGATWGALKLAVLLPGEELGISAAAAGPKVKATPKKLKFPTSFPGEKKRITVTFTNKGSQPGVLTPGSLPAGFTWFGSPPGTVAPGASVQATVEFSSDQLGRSDGELTITVAGQAKPVQLEFQAFNKNPIELAPRQLKFGKIATGTEKLAAFEIKNLSSQPLEVLCDITGTGRDQFFTTPDTVWLAPGEAWPVPVRFLPRRSGKHTASFEVSDIDSSATAFARLDGEATGSVPVIQVSDARLEFEEHTIGSPPAGKVLLVANAGEKNLELAAIAAPGVPFAFRTGEELADPTHPNVIPPHGQLLFGLQYAPTTAGQHTATLSLVSNDLQFPTATVTLTGSAVLPEGALFEVDRTVIDFGDTYIDEFEPPLEIYLQFTSRSPTVGVDFDLPLIDAPFNYEGERNFSLAAEGSLELLLTFKPVKPGPYETHWVVATTDPLQPTVVFTVRGRGIAPPLKKRPRSR